MTQPAILPRRHVSLSASFLGFGAFLLKYIAVPITADDLWERYQTCYTNGTYPVRFSLDQFIQTLDFLYLIGAIRLDEGGLLRCETHQS